MIDNPPFSIFSEICKFYSEAKIPFFLFGPGLTIFSALRYCSVVVISRQITFSNGAKVKCNFATNLLGDIWVTSAVTLDKAIDQLPSQNIKKNLPKYSYPANLLSVSNFQTIARGDEDFRIRKKEGVICRDLDCHPKKSGLFGNHILVTTERGRAAELAIERAAERAAQRAAKIAAEATPVPLSPREQRIIAKLDAMNENKG